MPTTIVLLCVVLHIIKLTRAQDVEGEVKAPKIGDCGGAFRMNYRHKKLTIGTGKGQYPPDKDCLWTIIGSPSCTPQVTCPKMDLRKDCAEEYVYISDGVGGELTICENKSFKTTIKASKGVRDLYINFVSGPDPKFDRLYTGFECTLTCVANETKAKVPELIFDDVKLKEDPSCVCGVGGTKDLGRIVGGKDSYKEEFPWQAALVRSGTRLPFCGGAVINSKYILTAAHCFFFKAEIIIDQYQVLTNAYLLDMKPKDGAVHDAELGTAGSIKASGWNLTKVSDKEENTQRYDIEEIIMHPLMNKLYDFDVALIKVKGTIPMRGAHEVLPICLPKIGDYTHYKNGMKTMVAGWGLPHFDAGATTRLLQKLIVPVIQFQDCAKMLPSSFPLGPRHLCAGFKQGKKDSCKGDSGGPLTAKLIPGQQTVVGIVSFGFKCALPDRPGVYSRVTELNQWIHFQTRNSDAVWCKSKQSGQTSVPE